MLERSDNDKQLLAVWNDIQMNVRTDGSALDVFYDKWQQLGLKKCSRCLSENIKREPGQREGECTDCGYTCWITSGTILERATLFKGYLAAARFCEAGLTISGPEFSRLTGIAQTSSYTMLRKFKMAIADEMPPQAEEFSGSLLKLLIAKRTLATAANCHPYTEQELIEEALRDASDDSGSENVADADETIAENHSIEANTRNADANDENLSEYEKVKIVVQSLLSDIGLTADTISIRTGFSIGRVTSSLSELELFGEARVEPGGKYFKLSSAKNAVAVSLLSKEIVDTLNIFARFVTEYFHRVGRKNIQTYLAALWCALDRERWGEGTVLQLCGEHPPIPYRQIRNYISPPLLKVVVDML